MDEGRNEEEAPVSEGEEGGGCNFPLFSFLCFFLSNSYVFLCLAEQGSRRQGHPGMIQSGWGQDLAW